MSRNTESDPDLTFEPLRRVIGKLLLVWGALLPLIALPYTLVDTYPPVPLLILPLTAATTAADPGALVLAYHDVIAGALTLIGMGLSFLVLPPPFR
jgi:hypothetical protein